MNQQYGQYSVRPGPEVKINPNHPNPTIWHNKIDVCMFVGVHCHQANLSLKIIRGGTNCYTIAMCAQAGHEDACLSFRDASAEKIMHLAEWVKKLKGAVPFGAIKKHVTALETQDRAGGIRN